MVIGAYGWLLVSMDALYGHWILINNYRLLYMLIGMYRNEKCVSTFFPNTANMVHLPILCAGKILGIFEKYIRNYNRVFFLKR